MKKRFDSTGFSLFLKNLGGLHDATLTRFTWDPSASSISIEVDDLNSNFHGLPEYSGSQSAVMIFSGVRALNLQVDGIDGGNLQIYSLSVEGSAISKSFEVHIKLVPGGFASFSCVDVELEAA